MKGRLDKYTNTPTTGHEWDGIEELDTPVPWGFRLALKLAILIAATQWVLYPAWPYVVSYTSGMTGYSSRAAVAAAVKDGRSLRDQAFAVFVTPDLEELASKPGIREKFEPVIGALYRDNCSACHGRDLKGQANFPNLTDDHWLWSGELDEIEYTLQVGINSNHEDTRYAEMPAFGRDEILLKPEITDVVEYVLSISGQEHDLSAADRGAEIFAENCSGCHNDGGAGGYAFGAPSLIDSEWIYGGDRKAILATLNNGRAGIMPAWSERLNAAEIRMLTLYVQWAGSDDQGD
ncbi:MAG: cytochrome-c oxidase, cbb3-type subunit III [Marinovum sp.]|nr:cytochrome-c oxidase, cbb3-type subunit III [Marinovum sp.]